MHGLPFPASPLTATREYVDVVRQVLRRRAPVEVDGRFHPGWAKRPATSTPA